MGKRPSFSLVSVFLTAFILRLFLSYSGTFELDFYTFVAWSTRLVEVGFGEFYKVWSDYLPGYLYILWFLGTLKDFLPSVSLFPLYKLPAILADILSGALIFIAVSRLNKRKALLAAAFYLFNPAVIANSALWGQIDGITALFSLASLFFATNYPGASSLILAVGSLFKPQAGFIAPLVALLWYRTFGFGRMIRYVFLTTLVFLAGFIPFASTNPFLPFVLERLSVTANQYPYSSVNAFNFWAIFGFWRPDTGGVQIVGIMLTSLFVFFLLWYGLKKKELAESKFLLSSLFFVISFLFLTRMHERHLLPALAPLTIAAAKNSTLLIPYTIFSLTYLANLYFSFIWINEGFRLAFSQIVIDFTVLANLASLGIIVFFFLKKKPLEIKDLAKPIINLQIPLIKTRLAETPFVRKNAKVILTGILVFAAITRLFNISFPQTFYFDEVYHAWTAREMLRGNTAAWEWWNTPPPGFAYEWTHPPLAKLGMGLGMLVFGENPLGWRILGALLGVGSVLLVYLIGAFLFKNKTAALLASAIFALDGLPLVMSRIGMNDSYFLFFALATIYFFLNKKIFLSAFFFGLSLSSKWTAFWLVPILVGGLILFKRKPKFEYLLFLVIPSLIYVFSYLPFFASGHSFSQFIELQGQMWWYHTGLSATHPFQSSWWSWPILYRPIWLFTQTRDALVSNIYAMGNPLIFWFGLVAVLLTGIKGVLERNNKLLFLTLAYLGFFLPWALSPRIMFLYHYLPSLPFLALATGWLLARQRQVVIIFIFLLFAFCFLLFYPHWTGIFVPRWLDNLYYWLPSWR